jgi:hypothetical protein
MFILAVGDGRKSVGLLVLFLNARAKLHEKVFRWLSDPVCMCLNSGSTGSGDQGAALGHFERRDAVRALIRQKDRRRLGALEPREAAKGVLAGLGGTQSILRNCVARVSARLPNLEPVQKKSLLAHGKKV